MTDVEPGNSGPSAVGTTFGGGVSEAAGAGNKANQPEAGQVDDQATPSGNGSGETAGPQEAKIATVGIEDPDQARPALQTLAGEELRRSVETLPAEIKERVIFAVMEEVVLLEAQGVLELARQDLTRFVNERRVDPKMAQKILQKLNERVEKASKRKDSKTIEQLVPILKNSSNPPETRALGYDLEIASIEQEIAQRRRFLETIPAERSDDRKQIEEEISQLEQKKQKLEQERREIKAKDEDGNEIEIPNQAEALAYQVLRAVKRVKTQEGETPSDLTEEDIKAIQENPLTALTSYFAQGLEAAINIGPKEVKKGKKTENEIVINPDTEKFNQFLTALVEEGVIEEGDKQSMADYFQKATKAMEGNLTREEKQLIFQEKSKRVVVSTSLGLGAIFLVLIYLGYKSEMGGGQKRSPFG